MTKTDRFEEVSSCNLCGNTKKKVLDINGHIVQCTSCGLKFVSPRASQTSISQAYDWSYENCPGWGKVKPDADLMYERRFDFLSHFITKGRLFDVGAGLGEFLNKANKTNSWECSGSETSTYAIMFAKKEFDVDISLGQLEELNIPDKSYDAVTLWHVLEHLPNPTMAIKEINRILKDNGLIFIAVPNDSWLARRHFIKNAIKTTFFKNKLKLKKMYPHINEEGNKHLFYFTPKTLTRLLTNCNFKVEKLTVDYDFEKIDPNVEKTYKFNRLINNITGLVVSNSMMVCARKLSR